MMDDGRMTSQPKPGAEPFAADGGRTGVLLSHGFTGSPASMTPWARHLAGRGHTVRVPLLPEFVDANTATGQFVVERDRYTDP